MMKRIHRIREAGDAGSALVAAIGVAVVGIALSTIVVSQAIVVMNDAARDRVRTVEIHAAEAALDATLKVLETETPCDGNMSVSEGVNAVDVAITIKYSAAGANPGDGLLPLVCDPDTDTLSGTPVQAEITAHATPTAATPAGVRAERKIQTTVNLVPTIIPSMGAAIFVGGGTFTASNQGQVQPLDPAYPAQVWIEGKDWLCSNSYEITGDVITTDGSIRLDNTCRVKGNTWSTKNATEAWGLKLANQGAVEGDAVVYAADLLVDGSQQFIGGDLSVGGNIGQEYWWGRWTVVGTVCSNNFGPACGTLPLYEAKGLAEVTYDPTDWPASFVEKDLAGFVADLIDPANNPGLSANEKKAIQDNPCHLDNQIKHALNLPTTDRIYDLRACEYDGFTPSNGQTFVVHSDVAFFSKAFHTSNQFLMMTNDTGADVAHDVWFIVPDFGPAGDGVSTCPYTPSSGGGQIMFSNQTKIQDPVHLFVFTPCTADISNNSDLVGQIYGGTVKTSNDFTLLYTGMGIPGVDLGGPPTTSEDGYSVEIVNKREITN